MRKRRILILTFATCLALVFIISIVLICTVKPSNPDVTINDDDCIVASSGNSLLSEDGELLKPFDQTYPEAFASGEYKYSEESILVKFKDGFDGNMNTELYSSGIERIAISVTTNKSVWYNAYIRNDYPVDAVVNNVRNLDFVSMVDYDYILETEAVDIDSIMDSLIGNSKLAEQWHLSDCGIKRAWQFLANNGSQAGGSSSVTVAVIDTGVDYNHIDLKNNMWINTGEIAGNGIDDDGDGFVDDVYGADMIANTGDPNDDHGHGTHVAGIIASSNNKEGTVGVAYNAKIMAVKAGQSSGYFNQSDIAEGIIYAYEHGADVINMSFGGATCSIAVQDALSTAYSRCVLVAAAGNNNVPNEYIPGWAGDVIPNYPAALSYVIGVMSVGNAHVESGFSNWDSYAYNMVEYEVYAPGESIVSTIPNNKYASWNGTSMATPIVAGIAALLRSYFTDRDMYPSKYIMAQIASATTDSAYCNPFLGHPRHNVPNVVNAYDSLTKVPTPDVSIQNYYTLDSKDLNSLNNGDGVIDAGETIDLGLVLKNRWGMSKDTIVTINTINPQGGVGNKYVTFEKDTIDYGSIGTYSTKDYLIKDDQDGAQIITGVSDALRFTISKDCPNDYVISFYLYATYKNALDENDETIYEFGIKPYNYITINLKVRNGIVLPSQIKEDMTLESGNLYILPNSTYIPEGVTVTAEPGAKIQFWSNDPNDIYADTYIAYLKVDGTFITEGTQENPVQIYPSDLMAKYIVEINGNGKKYLEYTKLTNFVGNLTSANHCYFNVNYPDDYLYYRYLSNGKIRVSYETYDINILNCTSSIFDRFSFNYWSNSRYYFNGYYSLCTFTNCGISFRSSFESENCLFMAGYESQLSPEYDYASTIYAYNNFMPTINNIVKDPETGIEYVFVNIKEYTNIEYLNTIAKSLNGNLIDFNTKEEYDFINSQFITGKYYTGIYNDLDGNIKSLSGNIVCDEALARLNYDPKMHNVLFSFGETPSWGYLSTYAIIEIQENKYIENILLSKQEVTIDSKNSQYVIDYVSVPSTINNTDLVFTSDDTSIAEVNENGVITGVGIGSTTIHVYAKDFGCGTVMKVNVIEYVGLIDYDIIDDLSVLDINKQLYELQFRFYPSNATNTAINITCSNEEIVKIEKNWIIPVGIGNCKLTFTSLDNEIKKCIDVEVKNLPNDFKISADSIFINISDEYILETNVYPSEAPYDLIWESSNSEIASVDSDGKVTGNKEGMATIRCRISNTNLYQDVTVVVSNNIVVNDAIKKIDRILNTTFILYENGDLYAWNDENQPQLLYKGLLDFDYVYDGNYGNDHKIYFVGITLEHVVHYYSFSYNKFTFDITGDNFVNRIEELNGLTNIKRVIFNNYNNWRYALITDDDKLLLYGNISSLFNTPSASDMTLLDMEISDVKDIFFIEKGLYILKNDASTYFMDGSTDLTLLCKNTERFESYNSQSFSIVGENFERNCYNNVPFRIWNNYFELGYFGNTDYNYHPFNLSNVKNIYSFDSVIYFVSNDNLLYAISKYNKYYSIPDYSRNNHDFKEIPNYNENLNEILYQIKLAYVNDACTFTIENSEANLKNNYISINFSSKIYDGYSFEKILLKDSNNNIIDINKNIYFNNLVITFNESLVVGETYELNIPASAITNKFHSCEEFSYKFTYIGNNEIYLVDAPKADTKIDIDDLVNLKFNADALEIDLNKINVLLNGKQTDNVLVNIENGNVQISNFEEYGKYNIIMNSGALKFTNNSLLLHDLNISFDILDPNDYTEAFVDISDNNSMLYVNDEVMLNVLFGHKDLKPSFIFRSSDESIATIDEFGVIKALKAGYVVIECKIAGTDVKDELFVSIKENDTIKIVKKVDRVYFTTFVLYENGELWSFGKYNNPVLLKTSVYDFEIENAEKSPNYKNDFFVIGIIDFNHTLKLYDYSIGTNSLTQSSNANAYYYFNGEREIKNCEKVIFIYNYNYQIYLLKTDGTVWYAGRGNWFNDENKLTKVDILNIKDIAITAYYSYTLYMLSEDGNLYSIYNNEIETHNTNINYLQCGKHQQSDFDSIYSYNCFKYSSSDITYEENDLVFKAIYNFVNVSYYIDNDGKLYGKSINNNNEIPDYIGYEHSELSEINIIANYDKEIKYTTSINNEKIIGNGVNIKFNGYISNFDNHKISLTNEMGEQMVISSAINFDEINITFDQKLIIGETYNLCIENNLFSINGLRYDDYITLRFTYMGNDDFNVQSFDYEEQGLESSLTISLNKGDLVNLKNVDLYCNGKLVTNYTLSLTNNIISLTNINEYGVYDLVISKNAIKYLEEYNECSIIYHFIVLDINDESNLSIIAKNDDVNITDADNININDYFIFNTLRANIIYKVSNSNVATVDNEGNLLIKCSGSVVVSAEYEGTGVFDRVLINIESSDNNKNKLVKKVERYQNKTFVLYDNGEMWSFGDTYNPKIILNDIYDFEASYTRKSGRIDFIVIDKSHTAKLCYFDFDTKEIIYAGDNYAYRFLGLPTIDNVEKIIVNDWNYAIYILKTDGTLWFAGYDYRMFTGIREWYYSLQRIDTIKLKDILLPHNDSEYLYILDSNNNAYKLNGNELVLYMSNVKTFQSIYYCRDKKDFDGTLVSQDNVYRKYNGNEYLEVISADYNNSRVVYLISKDGKLYASSKNMYNEIPYYFDKSIDDSNIYEIKLNEEDKCNNEVMSNIHNAILKDDRIVLLFTGFVTTTSSVNKIHLYDEENIPFNINLKFCNESMVVTFSNNLILGKKYKLIIENNSFKVNGVSAPRQEFEFIYYSDVIEDISNKESVIDEQEFSLTFKNEISNINNNDIRLYINDYLVEKPLIVFNNNNLIISNLTLIGDYRICIEKNAINFNDNMTNNKCISFTFNNYYTITNVNEIKVKEDTIIVKKNEQINLMDLLDMNEIYYNYKITLSNNTICSLSQDNILTFDAEGSTFVRFEIEELDIYKDVLIIISENQRPQGKVKDLVRSNSITLVLYDSGELWAWGKRNSIVYNPKLVMTEVLNIDIDQWYDDYLFIVTNDHILKLYHLVFNDTILLGDAEDNNVKNRLFKDCEFYSNVEKCVYNNEILVCLLTDGTVWCSGRISRLLNGVDDNIDYSLTPIGSQNIVDINYSGSCLYLLNNKNAIYCFDNGTMTKMTDEAYTFNRTFLAGKGFSNRNLTSLGYEYYAYSVGYFYYQDGKLYSQKEHNYISLDNINKIFIFDYVIYLTDGNGSLYALNSSNENYQVPDYIGNCYEYPYKISIVDTATISETKILNNNLNDGLLRQDSIILEYDNFISSSSNILSITLFDANNKKVAISKDIIENKLVITPVLGFTLGASYSLSVPDNAVESLKVGIKGTTLDFTYTGTENIVVNSTSIDDNRLLEKGNVFEINFNYAQISDKYNDIALYCNNKKVESCVFAFSNYTLSFTIPEEYGSYHLSIPQNAFMDIYGNGNDAFSYDFAVYKEEEYKGEHNIYIKDSIFENNDLNIYFNYAIQGNNFNDIRVLYNNEIVNDAEIFLTNNVLTITNLSEPGKYTIDFVPCSLMNIYNEENAAFKFDFELSIQDDDSLHEITIVESNALSGTINADDVAYLTFNYATKGLNFGNILLYCNNTLTYDYDLDLIDNNLLIYGFKECGNYKLIINANALYNCYGEGNSEITIRFRVDGGFDYISSEIDNNEKSYNLDEAIIFNYGDNVSLYNGINENNIKLMDTDNNVVKTTVLFEKGILTITPYNNLIKNHVYHLIIAQGILINSKGFVNNAIDKEFKTINPAEIIVEEEYVKIDLLSMSIKDNACNVSLTPAPFIFRFTRAYEGAEFNNIKLSDEDGNIIKTIVELTNNILSISVDSMQNVLEQGHKYFITIPSNAIVDARNETTTISVCFSTYTKENRVYYNLGYYNDLIQNKVKQLNINPTFNHNVILNDYNDTIISKWTRIEADSSSTYISIPFGLNYWGTTNDALINKVILDFDDYQSLMNIDESNYLTEAPSSTFPFVTSVKYYNAKNEETKVLGNELMKVVISFNRAMDVNENLTVRFGSCLPYADYTVDGAFTDEYTWVGTYTLKTTIENGNQKLNISGGCAKDDKFMKLYEHVGRFMFEIDTTSAQAMLMQGAADDGGIMLSWMQDDYETLAGYNIYRSTKEDGYYQRVNKTVISSDENTFYDDTVEPGTLYYYNFTVVLTDLTESTPSGKINLYSKDTMAPNIYHSPVYEAYTDNNFVISATITDNLFVKEAKVYYRVKGTDNYHSITMDHLNSKYSAVIGSSFITLDGLEYYIEATDGTSTITKGSKDNPFEVIVKQAIDKNALGDVDGDGIITIKDALLILLAINDQYNMTSEEFLRADLNGDGTLSSAEALKVLYYVNGKITSITQ